MKRYAVFYALWAFVLAATNQWPGWNAGIEHVQANDVRLYEAMAQAAPGFPAEPVTFHHGQRFLAHYLVGTLAKVTGIPLHALYRATWLLLALLLVALVHRSLARLQLAPPALVLCLSALLGNVYVLRYYAIVPGMLQDFLFLVGTALVAEGVLADRAGWLVGGALVATLGRQTSVMLLPGLALWGVLERRRLQAAAAAAVIVVTYVALGKLATGFSTASGNLGVLFGIVTWLESGHARLRDLAELFLRVLMPFTAVLGLLAGLAMTQGRKIFRDRKLFYFALFAGGIALQPLMTGPELTGKNGSRLGSLGVVFAIFALGLVLKRVRELPAEPVVHGLLALLMLGSLHHLYSVIGPATAGQFALCQLVIATIAIAILVLTTPGGQLALRRKTKKKAS